MVLQAKQNDQQAAVDSPKSMTNNKNKLSSLKTKSSKRSSAYSKEQVQQLIDLFPEIAHITERTSNENSNTPVDLAELFPDALAELVQILGSTKKVEEELLRRKQAREKKQQQQQQQQQQEQRDAAAERDKNNSSRASVVRFAPSTVSASGSQVSQEEHQNQVFETLETEALRRAGIADRALANAKTARDKVHKLYQGLISTTTPVGADDLSISASTISTKHTATKSSRVQVELHRDQQQQQQQQPQTDEIASIPGSIPPERWGALRAEARVIITRRLLVGWKMTSDVCQGDECNHCPLLAKQDKLQCVVCGGGGSGTDGMYGRGSSSQARSTNNNNSHNSHNNTSPTGHPTPETNVQASPILPLKKEKSVKELAKEAEAAAAARRQYRQSLQLGHHQQQQRRHGQMSTPPLPLIEEAHTAEQPSLQSSQDSLSQVLGSLQQSQQQQQQEQRSPSFGSGTKDNAQKEVNVEHGQEDIPDEFELLLKQQRSEHTAEKKSTESCRNHHPTVAVYELNSESVSVASEEEAKSRRSQQQQQHDQHSTHANSQVIEHHHHYERDDFDDNNDHVHLDEQQKEEILNEVKSLISKASSRNDGSHKGNVSKVGREILLKTAQGWSLIDASCGKCDMPLLVDPTGREELCVFCAVEKDVEIYLDREQDRCTPSEMTETLYSKHNSQRHQASSPQDKEEQQSVTSSARKPPTSVKFKSSGENQRHDSTTHAVDEDYGDDLALRAVASPGFDEESMFPFLKEKPSERRIAVQESRSGSFAGSAQRPTQRGGFTSQGDQHRDAYHPSPQTYKSEARQGSFVGSSSQQSLHQRSTISPREHSHHEYHQSPGQLNGAPRNHRHHERNQGHYEAAPYRAEPARPEWQNQDHSIYDRARQRIQSSQSSTATPYSVPQGSQPNADQSWKSSQYLYVQSAHTEDLEGSQYRVPGADSRGEPSASYHDMDTRNSMQSREVASVNAVGSTPHTNPARNVRVTKSIKVGRMNGHKKAKTIIESPVSISTQDHSPQHTLPVSKIDPNDFLQQNQSFQQAVDSVVQSETPRHANTTPFHSSGPEQNATNADLGRSFFGTDQQDDCQTSVSQAEEESRTTAVPSGRSQIRSMYTLAESMPAEMSSLSEFGEPLTSLRETDDEAAPTNGPSGQDNAPQSQVPYTDAASLVSSLGLPGVEEIRNVVPKLELRTAEPHSSENRGMGDKVGGFLSQAIDRLSPTKESGSLISSILYPSSTRNAPGGDTRSDPPDAQLHNSNRTTGVDPEEGVCPISDSDSPEKARKLGSPIHCAQEVQTLSPDDNSVDAPRPLSPSQQTQPTSENPRGYSIMVPENFDFDDEAKLRELVLAARKQQSQKIQKEAKKLHPEVPPVPLDDQNVQSMTVDHSVPLPVSSPTIASSKQHPEDLWLNADESVASLRADLADDESDTASPELPKGDKPTVEPSSSDTDTTPVPALKRDNADKSSFGYLDSLINSIRAPARAWAKEKPEASKDGRSDPPASTASEDGHIRVAMDPETDIEEGSQNVSLEPEDLSVVSDDMTGPITQDPAEIILSVSSDELTGPEPAMSSGFVQNGQKRAKSTQSWSLFGNAEPKEMKTSRPSWKPKANRTQTETAVKVKPKQPNWNRERKVSPKPEVSVTEVSVTRKKRQNDSSRLLDDDQDTLMLVPRVQSPYFENLSMGNGPDLSIPRAPTFSKPRTRREPGREGTKSTSSRNRRHSSGQETDFPRPQSRNSRSSSGRFSLGGQADQNQNARGPSFGEDEPSQRGLGLLISPSVSVGGRDPPIKGSGGGSKGEKSGRHDYASSLSSWTTQISKISKGHKRGVDTQKRRAKPSTERRLSDGLKFDASSKFSVVSSNSSTLSWTSRGEKLSKPSGPLRRATLEQPDPSEIEIAREKQTPLGKHNVRSFGSYSSWATNDRTRVSREERIRSNRTGDDDVYFVGGPLSIGQKPPTDVLSPASAGSDSTPFEDILNRCKFKLEQLSTDDESNKFSLPGRHMMSMSSAGSQTDVIDLVSR